MWWLAVAGGRLGGVLGPIKCEREFVASVGGIWGVYASVFFFVTQKTYVFSLRFAVVMNNIGARSARARADAQVIMQLHTHARTRTKSVGRRPKATAAAT